MNTTQFDKAGELQGIVISKNDLNFQQTICNMVEIINEHPHYTADWFGKNRIMIGKTKGNDILTIKTKYIQFISVTEENIHIMCKEYNVAIEFKKPTFFIY